MPTRAQYYFMTSMPAPPNLGEKPPMSLEGFYDRACDHPGLREAVEAVLLEHDLLGRQSLLAGESEEFEPIVLTSAMMRGEEPLPTCLQVEAEADQARVIGDDAMWEAYFRHVVDVAEQTGCEFLRRWVGFEVALRNSIAAARAKALDLIAEEYFVAADLAGDTVDTEAIVAAWASAGDPLAAMKALDQGRWEWLARNGGYYSFEIDEAAAYARGLVLLHRWQKLSEL